MLEYEITPDGIVIKTKEGKEVGIITHEFPAPGVDPMSVWPWVVYYSFKMPVTDGGETGPRALFNSLEAAKYTVLAEWLEAQATTNRIESDRVAKEEKAAGRA